MKNNIVEEIKKLKHTPGNNLTLLGSGSIVNQFAYAGLIDELQLLVQPVALGEGTPILKGVKDPMNFELANSRVFETGNVLLVYRPT